MDSMSVHERKWMLEADVSVKAHYLAYRWYRQQNAEANHAEGWSFAVANWQDYRDQAMAWLESLAEEAAGQTVADAALPMAPPGWEKEAKC